MHAAIKTVDLTKFYGKSRGIVNLNVKVELGEIFGLIGPNGAGKSTFIRTLLSLIHKTSGSAKIFGLDCEQDKVEILSRVGYLPSEIFYYDNMKAIDLLKYSASFYKKDCKDRIDFLADALDLDVNKKIQDMSLGNKKKVGIVQGLLHSPKLIILDEPTSGLDPLMQKTFFELIRQENEQGTTILFSSHILIEVERICNRVAIIKDGEIVSTQSIETLHKNSYRNVSVTSNNLQDFDNCMLEGVSDVRKDQNRMSFIYRGDCNLLLTELAKRPLLSVDITEPSLEEIFMHYYSD